MSKQTLHWYNSCNHGDDDHKIIAKRISEVSCKTCIRHIIERKLKDPTEFMDLNMVPLFSPVCPVCGHIEEHLCNGHHCSNHYHCPVIGFDVKYNEEGKNGK